MNPRPRPSAFTLVEFLVAIAVLGVLAAILIPVVGGVRDSARESDCRSNLRQLASLYLLYVQDQGGKLLAASEGVQDGTYWQLELQEFVDADARQVQLKGVHCKALLAANPAVDGGDGVWRSTYGLNNYIGRGGVNPGDTSTWGINYISQAPEPSRTLLFADPALESPENTMVGVGYEPNLFPVSYHPDGRVNIAYLDGHVGSLRADEIPTSDSVYPKGRDGSIFWRGW